MWYPDSNSAPSGAYGSGSGAGFRYGSNSNSSNAPPHRPPEQQMTPEQKEGVLLAAGRLAAEYLVAKGELPPHVLQNRPPPPPPPGTFQERPHEAPQHGRPFQKGGLPQFWFQQGATRPFAPRAFQDRPIAKRPRPQQAPRPFQRPLPPRPFQGRPPFLPGGRGAAPPETGCIGHGAAQAGSVMQGAGQDAPAGDGISNRQPLPVQSGGAAESESPKTTDQPNQR